MEKYLILKLDEETLTHFPEKMSDVPLAFDSSISENELQYFNQIILVGNGYDLKTLENILFPDNDTTGEGFLT